jgi:hypothetical protein
VGLTSTMSMASSIQPIGLRGRRAASNVPTAVTGITAAAPSTTGSSGAARRHHTVRVITWLTLSIKRSGNVTAAGQNRPGPAVIGVIEMRHD